MDDITTGGLLNGRVTYQQLCAGHRTGFEPVLLAACVPARAGERVLEAGTGAGAALLCLTARVPGVIGVGVEYESTLARLANKNFKTNKFLNNFCLQADAMRLPFSSHAFHHVMANPPWFGASGTPSPDPRRALAHQADPALLNGWIASLIQVLRPRGSIALVLPAASFAQASAALRGANCGGITLFPLWPRAGEPAKIILLTARKDSKSPDRILPGLVLHDDAGITDAAQAILRDSQPASGLWNAS